MKRFFLIALAVILVYAQISFIPALRPLGVVPDAVLVAVVLFGLEGTASAALVFGLAGGLVLDMASGADFGLRMGLFSLIALAAGLMHRSGFDSSHFVVTASVVTVSTLIENIAVLVGLWGTGTSWPLGHLAGTLILQIMLNLLITIALIPVVRRLLAGGNDLPVIRRGL